MFRFIDLLIILLYWTLSLVQRLDNM